MLKEVTKNRIVKLLNEHSYGNFRNGNLSDYANEFEFYPDYLANVLRDHFIISKRELNLRNK